MFAGHVSEAPQVITVPGYEPQEAGARPVPTGSAGVPAPRNAAPVRGAEVHPFNRLLPGEPELRVLVRYLLEVLEGRRPLARLGHRLAPGIEAKFAAHLRAGRFRGHRELVGLAFRLVSRSDALEVWGTVREAGRVVALAARVELHRRRPGAPLYWRCAEFDLVC